jgi:hypothetical protein
MSAGAVQTTFIPTPGAIYLEPFFLSQGRTFTSAIVHVTSHAANDKSHIGIYYSDTNGQPAGLAIDFGEINLLAIQDYTWSGSIALAAGAYFIAYQQFSNGCGLRAIASSSAIASVGFTSDGTNFTIAGMTLNIAHSYGALPSSLAGDAVTYSASAVNWPWIGVR